MQNLEPQLPDAPLDGHSTILHSTYLTDIPTALTSWSSQRVVLVGSKTLAANTSIISDLAAKLGPLLVSTKLGVGAHSPYADVRAIAHLVQEHDADALVCVGSSSYSDACKIALLLAATLPRNFTDEDMEATQDPKTGLNYPGAFNPPNAKLILVPTSLSASEWNNVSSASNASGKKQHFQHAQGAPSLILLDPVVAVTAPERLWLASGVRAVDHCVETLCNPRSHAKSDKHCERGLRSLLVGLKAYKEGKVHGDREELLKGISSCQLGSREAMMPCLIYKVLMGPSHAIGHQLGSVGGVLHGETSCVLLAPVLRSTKDLNPKAQKKVVDIFNEALGWHESEAGDAVQKFVAMLGLPTTLSAVGVTDEQQIEKIAEKSLTDALMAMLRRDAEETGERVLTKEDIMNILNLVR